MGIFLNRLNFVDKHWILFATRCMACQRARSARWPLASRGREAAERYEAIYKYDVSHVKRAEIYGANFVRQKASTTRD